jgi:carbonic anhydrase
MAASETDALLHHAERYAERFDPAAAGPAAPARRVAVLACMDARIDPAALLGLRAGDAHVIRNAGGVVTDDAIRSLAISQRKLGTEEVVVIQHTGCGLMSFDDDEFARELERDAGERPGWAAGTFADLEANLRASVARIRESRFLPRTDRVRGFVYDVESGALREVP